VTKLPFYLIKNMQFAILINLKIRNLLFSLLWLCALISLKSQAIYNYFLTHIFCFASGIEL